MGCMFKYEILHTSMEAPLDEKPDESAKYSVNVGHHLDIRCSHQLLPFQVCLFDCTCLTLDPLEEMLPDTFGFPPRRFDKSHMAKDVPKTATILKSY